MPSFGTMKTNNPSTGVAVPGRLSQREHPLLDPRPADSQHEHHHSHLPLHVPQVRQVRSHQLEQVFLRLEIFAQVHVLLYFLIFGDDLSYPRYISEKSSKDSSSFLTIDTSNESLLNSTLSTRSKKSKAKPTKRRPKTAGTALSTKKVEKQSSVEEAGKPSTRPRRHSIAIPRNKHVDSSSPKVVPGTIKPCFEKVTNTPAGVRSDHKAVEHTFNTNSVITATRTKSAVVSCKSRIETLDQSNLGRYDENVKMIQDGRLLNRSHVKSNYLKQKEKQLIRTVYTPSIRTNRTLSAPTTAPSEPLYARGQTRYNDERARYEDRTATIYNKSNQWPSRQNSAKTSGQDPFFRPSATYKWREHDHNTLLQNIALNRRFSYR